MNFTENLLPSKGIVKVNKIGNTYTYRKRIFYKPLDLCYDKSANKRLIVPKYVYVYI